MGQDDAVYGENLHDLQDCLDQFEQLEKPTIAQIHGCCLGGGLISRLLLTNFPIAWLKIAQFTAPIKIPEATDLKKLTS